MTTNFILRFSFLFYCTTWRLTDDWWNLAPFLSCALLGLSTATARHVDMFPPIGRPAETTCIDSDGENVWSASIRGTRSRHRDWRRSFLLSQSLVIIKMLISVWSFSFMQMQRTTMTTPDGCFAFDERKKARHFCPVEIDQLLHHRCGVVSRNCLLSLTKFLRRRLIISQAVGCTYVIDLLVILSRQWVPYTQHQGPEAEAEAYLLLKLMGWCSMFM